MNENLLPNTANTSYSSVAACVLAGGRGERLGRQNKGLLPWPNAGSPPLIASVLHRLGEQVGEIIISANADIPHYEQYGYAVASDSPEFADAGPLAGLLAAGEAAHSEWLLTAAVDCPRLPLDLAARLIAAGVDIAVAHDGQRLQPLSMLMSREFLPDLRNYLQVGGRSVYGWLDLHDYQAVDFSDQPDAFVNINTDADFKAYQ